MTPESRSSSRPRSRRSALILATTFAAACVVETTAPESSSSPPASAPRVLGFVELTFSGIGTPELAASAIVAPTIEELQSKRDRRDRSRDLRDVVAQDLTQPDNGGGGGDGTIQLSLDTRSQFVFDGVRYLRASFFVRNAQLNGAAYDTDRTNLTFLGVSTNTTINGTAVRRLLLDGGAPAPDALALQVLPTDLMQLDGTTLSVAHPDVLQILRESEVGPAALTPPAGVTSVLPYGFIVRRIGNNATRTLPASPGAAEFAGVVDFAFSIPQQAAPVDDPQTISVLVLAVDDSETRLTQGPQEQTVADRLALQQLDSTLNADTVTLLPGGSLPGVSGLRTLCSVRTAGTATSPTAHLVNVDWTFDAFTPNPHATDGSASHISSSADFQATFSAAPGVFGPETFTVRGLQSGPAFLGQTYAVNGTTISTPQGAFLPGEEIEVALTTALSCPRPQTARYRVEAGAGTGTFVPDSTYDAGNAPAAVAIGDLTGNGVLDVAVTGQFADSVSVYLGAGDGKFPGPQMMFFTGDDPGGLAIADLNGDGILDLAVANSGADADNISILIGEGNGAFAAQDTTFAVGVNAFTVAIGDLNGDGALDMVVANFSDDDVSVLLGNGDGTFQPQNTFNAGPAPDGLAIGDVNGDGVLDAVVSNDETAGTISVLLGNGDGTFQSPSTFGAGAQTQSVALGDLNADGALDIVAANWASSTVSVLLGDGMGSFQGQPAVNVPGQPTSIALGDLDGDGTLDFVTADESANRVSVFIGNGLGAFQPQPTVGVGERPVSIVLGDLSSDGILDIVTANVNDNSITVALGQTP